MTKRELKKSQPLLFYDYDDNFVPFSYKYVRSANFKINTPYFVKDTKKTLLKCVIISFSYWSCHWQAEGPQHRSDELI